MKKALLIIVAIVAMVMVVMGFWRYEPKIHNKLIAIKEKLHSYTNYKSMHKNVEQIAQLPDVMVNGNEWFCGRTIISHAGGVLMAVHIPIPLKLGRIHMPVGTDFSMQTSPLPRIVFPY